MPVTSEAITQEQLTALCVALREGSSVRGYLESASPGFSRSTLYAWLEQYATEEQKDQYARALASSADADSDDIRHIADSIQFHHGSDVASIARAKIDALKWIASKKKPKVYGDKTHQEITGKDGAPLLTGINVNFIKPNAD